MATRIESRAARVVARNQASSTPETAPTKRPGAGIHEASAVDATNRFETTQGRVSDVLRPRRGFERVSPGFNAERLLPRQPTPVTPGIEGVSTEPTGPKTALPDPLAELQPGSAAKREEPEGLPGIPGQHPARKEQSDRPGVPGPDPRHESEGGDATDDGGLWTAGSGMPKNSSQRVFENSLSRDGAIRRDGRVANEEAAEPAEPAEPAEGADGAAAEGSEKSGWWSSLVSSVLNLFSGSAKGAAGKAAGATTGAAAGAAGTVLTSNLHDKRSEAVGIIALRNGVTMGGLTDKGGSDISITPGGRSSQYDNPEAETPTGEAPDPLEPWRRRREEFARSDDYARFVDRVKAGRQAPVNPVPIDRREVTSAGGRVEVNPGDVLPDPATPPNPSARTEGLRETRNAERAPGDDLPDPVSPPDPTGSGRIARDEGAAANAHPDVVFDPIRGPRRK